MFTLYFIVMLSLAPQVESQPALGVPRDAADQASLEAIGRLIDEGKLDLARRQLQEEVTGRRENYQTLFLQARILFAEKRIKNRSSSWSGALRCTVRMRGCTCWPA